MICITFEREDSIFQTLIECVLAHSRAAASFENKMATMQHKIFFTFVSSLKLSQRLLCSVRFVFVSTFNLQPSNFITSIIKYNLYHVYI